MRYMTYANSMLNHVIRRQTMRLCRLMLTCIVTLYWNVTRISAKSDYLLLASQSQWPESTIPASTIYNEKRAPIRLCSGHQSRKKIGMSAQSKLPSIDDWLQSPEHLIQKIINDIEYLIQTFKPKNYRDLVSMKQKLVSLKAQVRAESFQKSRFDKEVENSRTLYNVDRAGAKRTFNETLENASRKRPARSS